MRGGTYKEALKVGFTEEQAGMLSRLSSETYSEAMNGIGELVQRLSSERTASRNARIRNLANRLFWLTMFVATFGLGVFFGKGIAL